MGSLQEHINLAAVNQNESQKKNKNKMNLRLNIPKQENAPEVYFPSFIQHFLDSVPKYFW